MIERITIGIKVMKWMISKEFQSSLRAVTAVFLVIIRSNDDKKNKKRNNSDEMDINELLVDSGHGSGVVVGDVGLHDHGRAPGQRRMMEGESGDADTAAAHSTAGRASSGRRRRRRRADVGRVANH